MSRRDSRLERLFGDGAPAFCAAFDLVPDPLGILWAIRVPGGAIADFETGYSNPAMAQMIGVPTQASMGRRLLDEAPDFRDDETFTRMRGVLESGRPEVVEVEVGSGDGPIGRVRGVFVHRAIPFGADGVLNLVTDVTEQRRMEDELRNYAKVAAHDLREPSWPPPLHPAARSSTLRRPDSRKRGAARRACIRPMRGRAASSTGSSSTPARARGWRRTGGHRRAGGRRRRFADERHRATARATRDRRATGGSRRPRPARTRLSEPRRQRPQVPLRRAAPRAISAERHEATWLFSVRDNGVGVPPDLGDEIFSMFKRAHGEEVEGCGIGLAVCRKIVEAHGGAIWAEPPTAPAPSCASPFPPPDPQADDNNTPAIDLGEQGIARRQMPGSNGPQGRASIFDNERLRCHAPSDAR